MFERLVTYAKKGTLAGEPLAQGLKESGRLNPPIFSPATKAEEGHDINVTARIGDLAGATEVLASESARAADAAQKDKETSAPRYSTS